MPAYWRESEEPIEREAVEIRTEDVEESSSDEPESFFERKIMSEQWFKKSLQILHDEVASCTEKTRLAL